MTISELLLQDFNPEMASTRRLLERIPEDNPEYKPHDKSFNIGKLSMHVATLPWFGATILTTSGMDMAAAPEKPRPDSTFRTRDIMLATFDSTVNECRAALTSASDTDLAAKWKFAFGEYVIMDAPRSQSFRVLFFNHMLHHRAQLTVYLRLLNIPVPGLYGPSADEPFVPK